MYIIGQTRCTTAYAAHQKRVMQFVIDPSNPSLVQQLLIVVWEDPCIMSLFGRKSGSTVREMQGDKLILRSVVYSEPLTPYFPSPLTLHPSPFTLHTSITHTSLTSFRPRSASWSIELGRRELQGDKMINKSVFDY